MRINSTEGHSKSENVVGRDIDHSSNGHRYRPAADEVGPNIVLSSDVVTDVIVRGEAYGPT